MYTIGVWGYSFASVAYAVFTLLILAAHNQSSLAKWILLTAIIASAVNVFSVLQLTMGYSLQWVMLLDAIKIAFFSVLTLSFNTHQDSIKAIVTDKTIQKYLLFWLVITLTCWGLNFGFDFTYEYLFLLFVVLNLTNLVILEQLYRGATVQAKKPILPLVVALGGMAVFDFVLYAQATMVGGIDFDFWYSRGYISALAIPFLLVSTRRIKEGSVRLFVSRSVVFYSSILMIAGLYLLLMAIVGYLINYLGGEWGQLFSFGFLILGSIVLSVVLITESFRRQVKVFISKNFFANKYEYRKEWLELIEKIETANADNYYQMSTDIMMSKVEASAGAIIKFESSNRYSVPFSKNISIGDSFVNDLILVENFIQNQEWIIDINEYSEDPLSYPGLFLHSKTWQAANINILVPIFIGKVFYGFFLLANDGEYKKLNWEDRDLLFAVAKQLGNFISLYEANDKLAESKQFDAFNRMSAFLVHDLKNVQAQLALITSNATQHRDNPEFIEDVFETVESATQRLAKMLNQLRNKQAVPSNSKDVELSDILKKVIKQRNIMYPQVTFIILDPCKITLDEERFFSVMNHLLQNAQEATSADGWVKVNVDIHQHKIQVTVSDSGCGMSEEFIKTRLFKPFDTTKGNAGMGIGVFEAKQFFESVGGSLQVESIVGQGTKMIISLSR